MANSTYAAFFRRFKHNKTHDTGIQFFSEIITQAPNDAEAYVYRARFYALNSQFDAALQDISEAVKRAATIGFAHFVCGNIHRQMGNYVDAVMAYSRAINVGYTRAYNNRGVMYLWLGKVRAAHNDFSLAIQHHSGNAHAYHNRAIARCHFHDFDGAVRDLTTAIIYQPDDMRSMLVLGNVYYAMGAYDIAYDVLHSCRFDRHDLPAEIRPILAYLSDTPHPTESAQQPSIPPPKPYPQWALHDTQPLPELMLTGG